MILPLYHFGDHSHEIFFFFVKKTRKLHHHVSRRAMSSLLMRFSRDPILDFFLPLVNQISSLCDARLPILYYIWPPIHLSGLLAIDYLRPSKTFPAPHHLQFAESLSRIFYVSETEKEGQIHLKKSHLITYLLFAL